jgi:hypothetical protein
VPAELRFLYLWMLTIACSATRAAIGVGSEEVGRRVLAENPAKIFDFGLDAVIASLALIAGINFYVPVGGRLRKPGTRIVITASDVATCSYVVFIAFVVVIVVPILAPSGSPMVTVIVPDIAAVCALAFCVILLT